jgi:hypothetical protein
VGRVPLCCAVLAFLGSISCGPKGFSPSEYQAAQAATDAIKRMYEYVDKGSIYYEERKRDAENALAAFPDAPENSIPKKALFKTSAGTCIMEISLYRTELELASRPRKRTKAEAEMADYDFKQAYYQAAKCVKELPSLLPIKE